MTLLLISALQASDPMDIQGMFLGASRALPWGSTTPVELQPKCEDRGSGMSMCLASDEKINANTRSQTQFGYCNGKLVSVTGFFYGKGARDAAAVMLGMIQSQIGPPSMSGQDATWRKGEVVLTLGPAPLPEAWALVSADLAGMKKCG